MTMRGDDQQQTSLYSYVSPEQRVPADHPLRVIRRLVDTVLKRLSPRFESLYAEGGRPSIAPERLLPWPAVAVSLFVAQRTAADGAAGLQPVVPLVRGLEYG
jgi:hypothetical protein